jgi:hypothetical protein
VRDEPTKELDQGSERHGCRCHRQTGRLAFNTNLHPAVAETISVTLSAAWLGEDRDESIEPSRLSLSADAARRWVSRPSVASSFAVTPAKPSSSQPPGPRRPKLA